MLGRRFLLLVAVLMGLTALAASIAPREPLVRNRGAATPTPTPSAASADHAMRTVEKTISDSGGPTRVVVHDGDIVRLTVDSTALDSVVLLDQVKPVEADSPATFELLADGRGSHPITLLDAGRRIGTLVVR
jgi:hypothetical protein